MTELVNQGAYGCLYHPGLRCNGNTIKDTRYATKLVVQDEVAANEVAVGNAIKRIVNYSVNFVPVVDTCVVNLSKVRRNNPHALDKCDVVDNASKKTKFLLMKMPYVDSLYFYDYIASMGGNKKHIISCIFDTYDYLMESVERLAEHGIQTVQDLRAAHTATLRAEFGVVIEKVQRELQGTVCVDLQERVSDKKQIVSSRSFGQTVREVAVLKDAMSTFVANACAKLRAQGSHASLIQVFLYTNRFRSDLPQYNPSFTLPLPQPTNDSLVVNRWADYLVGRLFKPGYEYKKAAITLGEIAPVGQYQADWLEPAQATDTRLMDALDGLNKRFGRGTVKVSTQGAYQAWQMKQERKSPSYTTNWDSVPCI